MDRLFGTKKFSGAEPRDEQAFLEAYVMFEIAWELATGDRPQGLKMVNFTRAFGRMTLAEIHSIVQRLTAAAKSGEGHQEAQKVEGQIMLRLME